MARRNSQRSTAAGLTIKPVRCQCGRTVVPLHGGCPLCGAPLHEKRLKQSQDNNKHGAKRMPACLRCRMPIADHKEPCPQCGRKDTQLFDSQAEFGRYQNLMAMQDRGEIQNLRTQVPFPIYINNIKVGSYIADFVYVADCDDAVSPATTVVEDLKGHPTPLYKFKKRCVEAYYGIEIKESKNGE